VSPEDGAARFSVDTVVHGDIIIRGRHVTPSDGHETMFRAAFHTGYARAGEVVVVETKPWSVVGILVICYTPHIHN
jgi:hypothetical protein